MEYKMDKKEVASRLQEILDRNSDRKVNKLIPEDIRQLNICITALTIPVVVGQSEQLKAFSDYAQKRMWEDGDKDLSEFVDEFLRL